MLDARGASGAWIDAWVMGTGDYAEERNSDIVVITSGLLRKLGTAAMNSCPT